MPQPVSQPRRTPGPVVAMRPRRVRVRAVTVEMVTVRMPAPGTPRTTTTVVVIGQRVVGIDVMRCGRALVVAGGRPGVMVWRPVLRRAAGGGLAHVGTCPSARADAPTPLPPGGSSPLPVSRARGGGRKTRGTAVDNRRRPVGHRTGHDPIMCI
ncbi:hypothetical protein GCM10023191_099190 [Actinoallomurus oryzae]|uniref:Uncharacterized protein n=1 Tax=Actinoallomurus oryzae TaxID=502180 RepID=A0ABP8R8W4_9ACTN